MSRILVVDDNGENRYLLQMLLASVGHTVDVAGDGVEALAIARATPPDLLVADVLMPRMDGFALCREWKADSELASIPFMVYTATYTEPKDEAFALSLGADRFVVKPQAPDELVRIVEDVLRSGRGGHRAESDAAQGGAAPDSEITFLKQHRDAVLRKLEQKMGELEAANASLRQDVAERLRVEAGLRESETRYRGLFENSPIGIYRTTPDGEIVLANPALLAMLGYASFGELRERGLEGGKGSGPGGRRDRFRAALERDGAVRGFEARWIRRDGSVLVVRENAQAIRGDDGRVLYYEGAVEDVTARTLAEEERRRLATAIEQSSEAVVISGVDGTIQYVNPAFESITGYRAEEAIGANPRILKSGRQPAAFYAEMWATITTGSVWTGRLTNRRKDGTLYEEEMSISPLRSEGGGISGFVAVKRDVTREVELQQQLTQSQKLEAIGRLAGGIAHDFNNLLQALINQIQLVRSQARKPDRVEELSRQLEQQVNHGASLTRQLLLFSRRETSKPERLDLNAVVHDATTMLRRLIRANIRLDIELSARPLPVEADRGQLDQVLMNLTVNASDAMPDGGRLTIRTGSEGSSGWLIVEDTGHGIPPELRDRIFEPFFTTKGPGKGTGLGLSVVHGIVAKHGGHVEVESATGGGTRFKVTIPRGGSGKLPAAEPADPPRALEAGRGERILLVEDEAAAREGLGEILTGLGYTVVAAASGQEVGSLPDEPAFDLLLADLMLPGLGGPAIAAALKGRWPALKVILMSGYAEDETVRSGVEAGTLRFLQKPFDVITLAREVRVALDA